MKTNDSAKWDRRRFLKTGAGALFLVAGAGLGPVLFRNRRVYSMSKSLMGTIGEIQVVHDDEFLALRAIEMAFEELNRIEKQLTYFSDDSEIGRINRFGASQDINLSRETAELIARALQWSHATRGCFEPGLGKVSALWDVKHRSEPPQEEQWIRLAGRHFSKKISLTQNEKFSTIRLLTEDVKIDLGGIGKGYAADRAMDILKEEGIDQALVNLGGDIVALGGKSESDGWRVGVKNPEAPHDIIEVLTLRNQAVATSGTYEQYFLSKGHVYHHLIDPKLAMPGNSTFESLTVIGNNCRDADALATGLFFVSDAEKKQILEDHTEGFEFMRFGA
ncbi:FAD:protein FMN transferase [bacterium]|nr:MAG: FAD:protein FMN transferase [bacterium]